MREIQQSARFSSARRSAVHEVQHQGRNGARGSHCRMGHAETTGMKVCATPGDCQAHECARTQPARQPASLPPSLPLSCSRIHAHARAHGLSSCTQEEVCCQPNLASTLANAPFHTTAHTTVHPGMGPVCTSLGAKKAVLTIAFVFRGTGEGGGACLVLPLKFRPHAAELDIRAEGGRNVIQNVDVDVVKDHDAAVRVSRGLVHDVAKYGTRLGRRNLDVGSVTPPPPPFLLASSGPCFLVE